MAEGHDNRGRFTKGNRGGPGRPKRYIEREYLTALSEACPPAKWKKIVQKAVEEALDGDAKAREWLSGYLLGKLSDRPLSEIAADEYDGLSVEDEIALMGLDQGLRRRQFLENRGRLKAMLDVRDAARKRMRGHEPDTETAAAEVRHPPGAAGVLQDAAGRAQGEAQGAPPAAGQPQTPS
jgi:hypothetical protein